MVAPRLVEPNSVVVVGPAQESLDDRGPEEERRNKTGSEENGPLQSLFDEALYQQEGIREHVSSFPRSADLCQSAHFSLRPRAAGT